MRAIPYFMCLTLNAMGWAVLVPDFKLSAGCNFIGVAVLIALDDLVTAIRGRW